MATTITNWTGPDGPVGTHVEELNERCLNAYRANPALVEEHANAERIQTEGGYGRRQVWELIQNGADEMLHDPGRVEVVLTRDHLYCANQGNPVTPEGAGAILSAYRSQKRGPEIGRFGLGFKSVLGVSDAPEFYSQSGSFGFDRAFAAERIHTVLGAVPDVPLLRLAMPLDAERSAREDELLRDLMAWATSVVRLPLKPDKGEWLPSDLVGFPAHFLVFSPHIQDLVLDDRTNGTRREIRLDADAQPFAHRLVENDREDVWRVFSSDFRPTAEAARDGGAMANREVIRFQWAVPMRPGQRTGGLWAYFPTLEEVTLSGVLNAPWKLNDDRTNVLEGPFNREILEHAVDLVLEHLEVLVAKDDPANILDVLPARGREERNWADGFLTDRLNAQAASHPTVPDQTGTLQPPSQLTLHPAGLPKEALQLWAKVPFRPEDWAHWSVDSNQTRRSRAERFVGGSVHGRTATVAGWLEALIAEPAEGEPVDVRASGFAILVAAAAAAAGPEIATSVREARIVLDAKGELVKPSEIYLPGADQIAVPGIRLVDPRLVGTAKARVALKQLGVERVDPELELKELLRGRSPHDSGDSWDELWRAAERVPDERALQILVDAGFDGDAVDVRVASGAYRPLSRALLPGDIARAETAPDVVIDVEHHRDSLRLLQRLGAVAAPVPGGARETEPAMWEYRKRAIEAFIAKTPRANPDKRKIIVETPPVAGPLTPIFGLEGQAKARYTRALLEAQTSFHRVEVSYPQNRYSAVSVEHPLVTLVREEGLAETSSGLVEAKLWVGPSLRPWSALLPVAVIPHAAAEALQVPERLEDLSEDQWAQAYEKLEVTQDVDLAARFMVVASTAGGPRPETWPAHVGDGVASAPIDDLRVTSSARTAAVLRAARYPVLVVDPEDVAPLVERWGLRLGEDDVATEVVAIETGPRAPLVDVFPALRRILAEEHQALELAWCSELRIETSAAGGRQTETTQFHLTKDVVYADAVLDHPGVLRRLSERLQLGLDGGRIDRIIENKHNEEIRKRIRDVRKRSDEAEKLAVVVSAERLRADLPASLLTAAESRHGEVDHVGLARLAFAVHGVQTLKEFAGAFEELGLEPPRTWAGSRQALEWVRKLGFRPALAGFPGARRDSVLEVEGPPKLNDLHDYQKTVVSEIRDVLRAVPGKGKIRGMMSLPTGAGKTRVAIQALVEAIIDEDVRSPILWVAQRDELCEQAVQAWSEIWRDRGPRSALTISRLWSSNEAEPASSGHQVVVATIDKLDSRVMRSSTYDWLKEQATCIVIDEAHRAYGPSYTHLLEWQGMDRRKERVPLIGLTATPYRGMSEDETKALANRFGNNRLDFAAFGDDEPYARLQDMGVLSQVEHRLLKGSEMRLTESEVADVKRTRLLPASASDRLAADVERNTVLLESIMSHPDDWTCLLFCTSLDHASVMAGLLSAEGVPTAAVSGATPPAARRHYVDEFRAGRIRVLTNYAVFTEGFDAPMVRAVYVARPTYSPNVYQQMIGRGLRGPANGGSPECLIVNVEDTFENFGEKLAFTQFDHLWQREAG